MWQAPPSAAGESPAFGAEILQAMSQLAARYYRHAMPVQAAQVYAFLVRHDPTEARHYLGLGKAEHAQGLHEQALQWYSRAIRLGLAEADVHLYIGQCLILLGRLPLAEQALQACLRLAAASEGDLDSLRQRAQQLLIRVGKHRAPTVSDSLTK